MGHIILINGDIGMDGIGLLSLLEQNLQIKTLVMKLVIEIQHQGGWMAQIQQKLEKPSKNGYVLAGMVNT